MSDDTLESRLDEAVTEALNAISPGVVTSWVLCAHVAGFSGDGDSTSSYPIVLMQNQMPEHVVRGLLSLGLDHIRGVGKWAHTFDDDDEEYEIEGPETEDDDG